jgi:hypothetical protein
MRRKLAVVSCQLSVAAILAIGPYAATATRADDPPPEKQPTTDNNPQTPQNLAALLLGNLTPDHMKQLGQMLEQDWKDRPEWGDMAVAVLKAESMRIGMGWWRPSVKRYDWDWLRGHFDADGDGKVIADELPTELHQSIKCLDRMDRDLDGQLTAADFDYASQPMMTPAAMQARMADMVFYKLDADSNGRISKDEIAEFFAHADRDKLDFLTPEDVKVALDDPEMRKPARQEQPPAAEMLRMFLTGQLGTFEAGPNYGDAAPDFTLPTLDGKETVTLSSRRGKPVVLIFGSFT